MSNLPTARQLLERLRETYRGPDGERLTDERLAARLDITGSTVARWKKKDTEGFQTIVAMLAAAGWLNTDADAPATLVSNHDPLEVIAARVAELARGQALIAAELGIQLGNGAQAEAAEKSRPARTKRRKSS